MSKVKMLITMFQRGNGIRSMTHLRKHFPACFRAQHQTSISTLFMNMPANVLRPPDCSINQSIQLKYVTFHAQRYTSTCFKWVRKNKYTLQPHSMWLFVTSQNELPWVRLRWQALRIEIRQLAAQLTLKSRDNKAVCQSETGNITRGSHLSGDVTWESNSKYTQLKGSDTN